MSAAIASIPNVAATLIDALIASNRGDRHAFTYNGKRYSYQDVAALMNRAGNLIRNLGVGRGEPVLVLLPPSPASVATVLGAIKARAVPVLAVPHDATALEECFATVRPAAAIVHEAELPTARSALQALARERVVVVGNTTDSFRSFVDELRTQPSWLAAEDVSTDEEAIGLWAGHAVKYVTHAALAQFAQQSESVALGGLTSHEAALLGNMVKAFHRGDELALT